MNQLTNQIEKALSVALDVHAGQVDKEGKPFILHILGVASRAMNDLEVITALLHDVVEDSCGAWNCEKLIQAGFSTDVVEAVDHLTRQKGEKYFEYVERCIKNPLAAHIKLYDLMHNTDPNRQNFAGSKSLLERHAKAMEIVWEQVDERL